MSRPRLLDLPKRLKYRWFVMVIATKGYKISGSERVLVTPDGPYTPRLQRSHSMSEQSTSVDAPRQIKTTNCLSCGIAIECQRRTKKWCSQRCYCRYRNGYPKDRVCLECGQTFQILTQQADANKKYCTYRCSKRANSRRQKAWVGSHPDASRRYRDNYVAKNPAVYRDRARQHRLEAIALLGGACCICGVVNTNWLHIDYIPTCRGSGGRHPRHLAFIRNNLDKFRLLCANHHYELTLTGKIEGTEITQ